MDEEKEVPDVGSVWNYGGDNYIVTRVDESNFLVLDTDEDWVDAIELTDKVKEGEVAKVTYVLSLDDFLSCYNEGEIEEGAEASQLPAEPEEEGEAETKD